MIITLSLFLNNLKIFYRDKFSFYATLLFPWVTSSILQVAMSDFNPFRYQFFCIIFSFWFFLNRGVRLIISEKKVIQREFYAGLSKGHYLFTKLIFNVFICIYVASVFAVSVNVEWVDWGKINALSKASFIDWIDEPIDFMGVDYNEELEKWEELDKRRKFQREYNDIKALPYTEFIFVYKRLRNENGFGMILLREKAGWRWHTSGSNMALFNDWIEIKANFGLFNRIAQQIIQLVVLDYGLCIFFLAALIGLSLGLFISAVSPTQEFAVQIVPYITIYQIIMSKDVIGITTDISNFNPITSYTLKSILRWDFGSILSLFTISRPLRVLAENLLLTAKNFEANWTYLFSNLYLELYIPLGWIGITYIACYVALKRGKY